MTLLVLLIRPFGVAFGAFILLNLVVTLRSPGMSVTRIWLDAPMAEPTLSLFAAVLGFTLVLPHRLAEHSTARCTFAGVFVGFALLVAHGCFLYYQQLLDDTIASDLPIPGFSLALLLLLVGETVRVLVWKAGQPRLPPPARVFFLGLATAGAFTVIILAYIVSFGHTDHRRPADAVVILGAKVYPDGSPCDALIDRLETGIETYKQGLVEYLIMTGARDPNGHDEPTVMARYAVAQDVPAERIILDHSGTNTSTSAAGCREIADEWGFTRLLAVTQYFHCARVQLAFERADLTCATVPTCSLQSDQREPVRLSREGFFLLREALAFPFYWLFRQ